MNTAAAPAFDLSGMLEMLLSLGLVVALIIGLSWVVGKLRGVQRAGSGALSVAAELVVGPKERVLLLRIGEQQALVGVSAAGVTPLTLLDKAIAIPEAATAPGLGNFAQRLKEAMGRQGLGK